MKIKSTPAKAGAAPRGSVMTRVFGRGRFANVTSVLALVLAMGGTSYAAYTLPHNSVGTSQIRYLAVKNPDLGTGAVTTTKVKDYSLLAKDFVPGQLPVGPQGPAGEAAAFASVASNGLLGSGNPWPNEGFGPGDIQHDSMTGIGAYCIGGMDFTPRSAMVSVKGTPALPTIATVSVNHGTGNFVNCDANHQQARVSVTKLDLVNQASPPVDEDFYVWLAD